MPVLRVQGPSGPPVAYRFNADRIRIGRAESCDLVIQDRALSRLHVELSWQGERWVIEDRGSLNGTLLNGRRLGRPQPLAPGDLIRLGSTEIGFAPSGPEEDDPPAGTATQPGGWSRRGSGLGPAELAIIGRSPAMVELLRVVDRVAASSSTVLILGENGTGKELLARHIHRRSPRATRPFVVVNCPALPGGLLEAELFGVERGVATGVEARAGRLETAEGGTLLLDEVGDLDPGAQAKLLRFLQDRTIDRVGGRKPLAVDVRLLAATNHDLEAAIEAGRFRRDLFHRLNVVTLRLPPLRERREDIPDLVASFLARPDGPARAIGRPALERLLAHDWPGNVRELEHVIERARLFARGPEIEPGDLPESVGARTVDRAASPGPAGEEPADGLYRRIVVERESFWQVVREPYLRRSIGREEVCALLSRGYRESGRSYKRMASLFGIDGEYKRLMNFLKNHDLRPEP